VCAAAAELGVGEPPNRPFLDEQGRQLVVGGFVALENIRYTEDDYRRMVRMGANIQVIRMPVAPLRC